MLPNKDNLWSKIEKLNNQIDRMKRLIDSKFNLKKLKNNSKNN